MWNNGEGGERRLEGEKVSIKGKVQVDWGIVLNGYFKELSSYVLI